MNRNTLRSLKVTSLSHYLKSRQLYRCYSSHPQVSKPSGSQAPTPKKRLTIPDIHAKYHRGIPLTMCTAYDYITATWVQNAQCDMLLVGDSLSMTSLGYPSTIELPFDEFKYHVRSVARASAATTGTALIVVDMPFGTFEAGMETGLANAIELMKLSSSVTSVKVEVGPHSKDTYTLDFIRMLSSRGIPVMGHIGLTPQRANSLGGFKVQANKNAQDIVELFETAKKLQEAGCWSYVIECVPHKVASYITSHLSIPSIGIGAGNGTSGQVLVISDLLGMQGPNVPKFVKQYANISELAQQSLEAYNRDVLDGSFPQEPTHTFKIKDDTWNEFLDIVNFRAQ